MSLVKLTFVVVTADCINQVNIAIIQVDRIQETVSLQVVIAERLALKARLNHAFTCATIKRHIGNEIRLKRRKALVTDAREKVAKTRRDIQKKSSACLELKAKVYF